MTDDINNDSLLNNTPEDGELSGSNYDAIQGAGYLSSLYSSVNKNLRSTLRIEAYKTAKRGNKEIKGEGFKQSLSPVSKGDLIDVFQVPFNPSSVSIEYRNDWQSPQGLGTSGAKLTFSQNEPERIKFKLIFADADVLRYGYQLAPDLSINKGSFFQSALAYGSKSDHKLSDLGVDNQVHHFLALTTQRITDGRPPYLVLRWGHVLSRAIMERGGTKSELRHRYHYPCQLESVDINYTLFSRHGFPLRAELDCTFVEDLDTGG